MLQGIKTLVTAFYGVNYDYSGRFIDESSFLKRLSGKSLLEKITFSFKLAEN